MTEVTSVSYRIIYNQKLSKKHPIPKNKLFKRRGILFIIGFVVLFGYISIMGGIDYIIPGDTIITIQAVEKMAIDIKNGQSALDALDCFCETILNYK